MVVPARSTVDYRKRIYWILGIFVAILFIKFGSKYVYLYTHHKECLVQYLRKSNFSQKIENIGPYEGSQSLCNEFVMQTQQFYRKIRMNDFQDVNKKLAECTMDKYDNSDIKLDAVYQAYLIFLKKDKLIEKEVEEHDRLMQSVSNGEVLKLAVFMYDCDMEEHKNIELDLIYQAAKKMFVPIKNLTAIKCFGEHLKKNYESFTYPEKYLNLPEVFEYECDREVIGLLRIILRNLFFHQKATEVFKNYPKFRECFMQKLEDLQIIDKMVTISMLGTFGMDEDTKNKEFKEYSDLLQKFINGLYNDCVKKHQYS